MFTMAVRLRASPRHGGANYRFRVNANVIETARGAFRGGGRPYKGGMGASAPINEFVWFIRAG